MKKRKYITPFDWPKTQLVNAWNEEKLLKEKVIADRDRMQADARAERAGHQSEVQSLTAKLADANARANKEQGRADSAEAALKRAHAALVTAVERLGGR